MKVILFFLILLLVNSCKLCHLNENFYSLYCDNGGVECSQIRIKSNGTFEYNTYSDYRGWVICKGKWEKFTGDTILINSFIQPQSKNTFIDDSTINGVFIKFNMDTTLCKKVVIKINNNFLVDTLKSDDKWFFVDTISVNRISITNAENNEEGLIFIANSFHNKRMELVDLQSIKQYTKNLSNEKLIIKKNELIWIDKKGKYNICFKKISYKKWDTPINISE
ncbi:MAG: hypothetical protein WCK02_06430 [Bacteroidota bacterium]